MESLEANGLAGSDGLALMCDEVEGRMNRLGGRKWPRGLS